MAFIARVSREMAGDVEDAAVDSGVALRFTAPVVVIDGELLMEMDGAGEGDGAGAGELRRARVMSRFRLR